MTTRWEETLTRRVRSLARTAPLHRIEANKAARSRDLSRHDLRALALRAIDATIEQMGLGYGAHRDDLVEAMRPLILAAEPGASRADLQDIAALVIDHLLNETDRRLQFDEPYLEFDGESATMRSVSFHLLKEVEADDGTIVLRATTEAINLYAGMLDVDVEDAQTAAEAVLKAQIERGAIGQAVATARQARLRSIEYAETLRGTLRKIRRDVSRVDTSELLARVASARHHVDQRLDVERGLLDAVDQRAAEEGSGEVLALVELRDALNDCRERHLGLHKELIGANQTWLAEQERQRFKRVRASALPDLERQVLEPLLAETLGDLEGLVDPLLLALHAASAAPVFHYGALVEALLASRRREREVAPDREEDELVAVGAREVRFDPEVVAMGQARLAGGGRLALVLEASREAGEPPEVRRYLVLSLLWAWDPAGGPHEAVESAGTLVDPEYQGHDLRWGSP